MTALSLPSGRSGLRCGRPNVPSLDVIEPLAFGDDPCGGERVIDFALCLVVAVAVVTLLLIAL